MSEINHELWMQAAQYGYDPEDCCGQLEVTQSNLNRRAASSRKGANSPSVMDYVELLKGRSMEEILTTMDHVLEHGEVPNL